MLTRWLTFTALLASSANPERAAIGRSAMTVAPTRRVKGHPEVALTLNCGDRKSAGVVQYWHTPFGDLQTQGSHRKPDPVLMQRDGSLMIPNTSSLHSGMYYCLLRHAEGTTLWPYELHVDREYKQSDAFRRDVGSAEERQAGVSDGQFAGAVAASVLLTFVVGFSTGALTRTPVLRCLGAITARLRSPRLQQCRTDTPEHGSEVTMTTLPPMCNNQAFTMAQAWGGDKDDDSANCATTDMTTSPGTTPPPVKPQRSFRQNRQQEEQNTTAYLEGCDYMKEEAAAGESQKERNKGCDREAKEEREFSGFYLEDGGSRSETDEERCNEDVEEKDGREENEEWRQGEEVEEAGDQDISSKEDGGERRESEEDEKKGRDAKREEEEVDDGEKKTREEDGETDVSSEDDETGSGKHEDTNGTGIAGGGRGDNLSSPGRRSRVIRLYQYDEEGQRYGHLPDAAPDEQGPAPKLKQRSLSLTRLNAIMAAASAGPLDTMETGRGEREDRPHFHMEI